MNSLSLVIYLADVLPDLAALFAIISILGLLAFGIVLVCGLVQKFETYGSHKDEILKWWSKKIWVMILLVFFIGVVTLVPSRQTILLIAGSEFGEEVVTTPEAKELLEGIRQVIKSQLEQYTKKE